MLLFSKLDRFQRDTSCQKRQALGMPPAPTPNRKPKYFLLFQHMASPESYTHCNAKSDN